MTEFLKSVDVWFLALAVFLLGSYFLWSVRNIFTGFQTAVEKLNELIEKLFQKHDNHESRISALEGRCDAMHGPAANSGGRRYYDPNERPGR